jgi:hypothetical protein
VITTIQQPTESVKQLAVQLNRIDSKLIVFGDQKGPASYDLQGVEFFSLADQLDLTLDLARKLPTGHYARKNLGYLVAISQGASCIYETDDDNAPLPSWQPRRELVTARAIKERGWVNVYRYFSEERIWPRGFSLDAVAQSFNYPPAAANESTVRAPIQQGLANNSPDVDAIWRLVLDRPFDFHTGPSIALPHGAWCPFNSQSTWWFPIAYPLMYLPSYCSFRMTDIWRSFVAQRCLWELECGIVFHAPEVIQERNAHNLMRDFTDELPGYQRNRELAERLEGLSLAPGVDAVVNNLNTCYEALVMAEFFPAEELELLTAWTKDLTQTKSGRSVASDPLLINAN